MSNLSAPKWVPIVILFVAIGLMVAITFYMAEHPSDPILPAIFQVLILVISITFTHLAAQQSVRDAAQEMIRERAKSALRRIQSISHTHVLLDSEINRNRDAWSAQGLIRLVDITLKSEMKVLDHAVLDWRDILPEDLKWIEESGEQVKPTEDQTQL